MHHRKVPGMYSYVPIVERSNGSYQADYDLTFCTGSFDAREVPHLADYSPKAVAWLLVWTRPTAKDGHVVAVLDQHFKSSKLAFADLWPVVLDFCPAKVAPACCGWLAVDLIQPTISKAVKEGGRCD